jgi:23S rRNA (pseudouridine1915-N3)-methyltransferase
MKILLLVTGKTDAKWLQQGLEVYIKRLGFYVPFDIKYLPDIKTNRIQTKEDQKVKEAEQMMRWIEGRNDVFLLDEHGDEFTSREWARFIERKMIAGCKELTFIIGGPFGFSESIIQKSTGTISFSKFTFSHQMVRLLFVEQLYRAFTIIRGEPYHHD